jgi:GMP synthase-like glutamine amidotransferase
MNKLKIHYLQHVPFEGLGCIENWALSKGHSLTSTKFYTEGTLPETDAVDWLIIMGGPMSVNDEAQHPWLTAEKEFIEQVIAAGKTVIGICLGSQLISAVLGSRVYPNAEKEIGWLPIQPAIADNNILFTGDNALTVFHWHGETFDLPDDAKLLASSEGCTNQAFLYNENVLGLQFHLEVTADSLSQMLTFGKEELIPGKYIQTEAEIKAQSALIATNNQHMYALLNHFEAR